MLNKPVVILDAPSNLGLMQLNPDFEPGVYQMPNALRRAGLVERLSALDAGAVERLPYTGAIDPVTQVRNAPALADYAQTLASAITDILEADQFPLVLGGDCSILLSAGLALKPRGRYGLLFIDGHADFLQPETSMTKGAAGMDLALVTGHGPEQLTNIHGLKPYFREEDVILFGNRDIDDEVSTPQKLLFSTDVTFYTLAHLRTFGLVEYTHAVLKQFADLDGFWVHVDCDVLDSDLMPAVDSPMPDGFSYDELRDVLSIVLKSPHVMGLQLTIYDPDKDHDGRYAQKLVEVLSDACT